MSQSVLPTETAEIEKAAARVDDAKAQWLQAKRNTLPWASWLLAVTFAAVAYALVGRTMNFEGPTLLLSIVTGFAVWSVMELRVLRKQVSLLMARLEQEDTRRRLRSE